MSLISSFTIRAGLDISKA